jgi:hypothetical protein
MFTIAYSKRTKKIVYARHDQGPTVAVDFYFKQHCEMNNIDTDDLVCIELPYDKKLNVVLGKYLYNPVTGSIEEDPTVVKQPTE